MEVATNRILV